MNKRAEITGLLQEAILSGWLKPGTRLPEMRLGRELGVSQAIIREALRDLESLGLVVKPPGQGSRVIELNADDLVHIYQVRSELESLVCGLAALHFRQQTFDALQSCLTEMRDATVRHDFLAFSRADVRFHRTIWSAQPNRFLEKSLESICLPLFAYDQIRRIAVTAMDFERVTQQHAIILRALRTGDSAFASRLMRHMMRRWLRIHLSEFERIPSYDPDEQNPAQEDRYAMLRASLRDESS